MEEIERKFLVTGSFFEIVADAAAAGTLIDFRRIDQAYVDGPGSHAYRFRRLHPPNTNPRAVPDCRMTIKSRQPGLVRSEVETAINSDFYEFCLRFCGAKLSKIRARIRSGEHVVELDHFLNPELGGLRLAEIELRDVADQPVLPAWLGTEVTSDMDYHNEVLAARLKG